MFDAGQTWGGVRRTLSKAVEHARGCVATVCVSEGSVMEDRSFKTYQKWAFETLL